MRAVLVQREVHLVPLQPAAVELEVTNDRSVIDAALAAVEAAPGLEWTAEPSRLPLFPEATGRIRLELRADPTFPAGAHEVRILLSSEVGGPGGVELLAVTVEEAPAATLAVKPLVATGRRRARYRLRVENTGNIPLEVALASSDPGRAARVRFRAPTVSLGPGDVALDPLEATARRHLLGGELSHSLTLLATAGGVELEAKALFRQLPLLSRGARTALVLTAIVALWAAIFVIVLHRALASDPLKKQVPASFYASVAHQVSRSSLQALPGAASPSVASSRAGAPPAGAVPKSGVVIGVGGTISGSVAAASTGRGIGRINVEVVQLLPGSAATVASVATGSNGSYSVGGLMPGRYKLRFEAQGFQSVWYPNAASEQAAKAVEVGAQQTSPHVDATISGLPGSITGVVDTGVRPSPPVTVTVQPEQGAATPAATVKVSPTGTYAVSGLATPGAYDLSFTSPDYAVATATDALAGGERLIANTVTLQAANGSISGVVTAGGAPLGGVTVTVQGGGQTFTTATPTTGPVGQFGLVNLPSPATYLLTFAKPGYGQRVIGEQLAPGRHLAGLDVKLAGGAGDISGEVLSGSGVPLGDATVTVDGAPSPTSTSTLTAGTVGSFDLSGLATPGTYVLTVSAQGYESETLEVPLGSGGSAGNVDVRLPAALGTITGTVTTRRKVPLTGVTVSATNGTTVTTTTSTSEPPGGFLLSGLPPGAYAVDLSLTGYGSTTYLVKLQPGARAEIHVAMAGG